jgi:hypothetical protein
VRGLYGVDLQARNHKGRRSDIVLLLLLLVWLIRRVKRRATGERWIGRALRGVDKVRCL